MKYRIMIMGNSGSGKSTLACALGEHLHIPVVHLDEWGHTIVHDKVEKVDREERNQRLLAFLASHDAWVIDGDWDHTSSAFQARIHAATHIFYLDVSSPKAVYRVIKRAIHAKRGRRAVGNLHQGNLSWEFLYHWVWKHKKTHTPSMLAIVAQHAANKLHIVRSYHEVRQVLAK